MKKHWTSINNFHVKEKELLKIFSLTGIAYRKHPQEGLQFLNSIADTQVEKEDADWYQDLAKKYDAGDIRRLLWTNWKLDFLSVIRMKQLHNLIADIIPKNTRIVDAGCGVGSLAKVVRTKRKDISYFGFDIIPENIKACKESIPEFEFESGGYWNILGNYNRESWDFVVSIGALFSSTFSEHMPLLFNVLNAASPKGFFVMTLNEMRGGPHNSLIGSYMEEIIETSKGVSGYYYLGKSKGVDTARVEKIKTIAHYFTNDIFFIYREDFGSLENSLMPDIPQTLKSFSLNK